jgi:hypothetical protein
MAKLTNNEMLKGSMTRGTGGRGTSCSSRSGGWWTARVAQAKGGGSWMPVSPTIVADVKRFSRQIKRTKFSAHTPAESRLEEVALNAADPSALRRI